MPVVMLALAVPVIAVLAVVATRVVEGPSPSASAAPARADAIQIRNFTFVPSRLVVAKGTTLHVTNDDGTTHTMTAKDGAFDTGDLGGGKSTTVKLNRPGTYSYFCKIHNYMTGTLVVR